MVEVNKITEVCKGHYQLILDFPDTSILRDILIPNIKYVWVIEHVENFSIWKDYGCEIYGRKLENSIEVRNNRMEYLMETNSFMEIIDDIDQSLKLYQINRKPPEFLDLNRIKGNAKYNLLEKEVDYLFELELPNPSDYAPIISPNLSFLEDILQKSNTEDIIL